jgi:hypothetical protein
MTETIVDFTGCFEDLETALADPKGIRIPFEHRGDAIQYRLKLHKARRKDRHENRELDFDHPLHGRSIYDRLVMRINVVKGRTYLYIEQNSRGEPQALSEVEDERRSEADDSDSRATRGEAQSEALTALVEAAPAIPRRRL